MKQIINGKTYNTETGVHLFTRVIVHQTVGKSNRVEVYNHIYRRRKDDCYFLHKVVFQFDEYNRMYYSWECIDELSDYDYEEWFRREHKTVLNYY